MIDISEGCKSNFLKSNHPNLVDYQSALMPQPESEDVRIIKRLLFRLKVLIGLSGLSTILIGSWPKLEFFYYTLDLRHLLKTTV